MDNSSKDPGLFVAGQFLRLALMRVARTAHTRLGCQNALQSVTPYPGGIYARRRINRIVVSSYSEWIYTRRWSIRQNPNQQGAWRYLFTPVHLKTALE